MQTVAIIDYEMGNLYSVKQAVEYAACDKPFHVIVTDKPEQVLKADRVILPGQGAMPDCMRKLKEARLQEAVLAFIQQGKPLLGVCVGMQMLLDGSEEGASAPGAYTTSLGLIGGVVKRFDLQGLKQTDGSSYKVPQMGWNQVTQTQPHPLWQGIADRAWFYFVHSYYAQPNNICHSVGKTFYGVDFTSAVARDNIFATQFHPEKSAEAGVQLYRNFLYWCP